MQFVYPGWLPTFVANVPNVSTIYVILEEEGSKSHLRSLKGLWCLTSANMCGLFNSYEKKGWKAKLEKFIVWNAWFTHLSKARMWYWGQRPTLLNCSNLIFKPKLEGLHKSKKTPKHLFSHFETSTIHTMNHNPLDLNMGFDIFLFLSSTSILAL